MCKLYSSRHLPSKGRLASFLATRFLLLSFDQFPSFSAPFRVNLSNYCQVTTKLASLFFLSHPLDYNVSVIPEDNLSRVEVFIIYRRVNEASANRKGRTTTRAFPSYLSSRWNGSPWREIVSRGKGKIVASFRGTRCARMFRSPGGCLPLIKLSHE